MLVKYSITFLSYSIAEIKYLPPPPLPPNYVCRQHLLDDIVRKLFQSTYDPNSYGTSLTVTGAGGFGKTSIVTALCHHPMIKEKFTDGVLFIELGPQATDPSMKLSQLYHLLTDQYLKQGDINYVEQEINQLTSLYCRNLLVIIDDVWHVEDAEPIVKAFSNCKIVLTTRMNDIEQYIPTKHVISVGPMEQSEAISLMTCGVIDISQLSQEDISLLDELAQDVHLWPLLLSLIRGQLSHNLKQYKLCYHESIQTVQAKLHDKGLTAFDKNNIQRSRKYTVKVCIEVTLDLLTKSLSDKLKSLILWTGIGTSLQVAVLHNLWSITEHDATDTVDILWAYSLVRFTSITLPPHNITQRCVEVHAVVGQYIIENMDGEEVHDLSPLIGLNTVESVKVRLTQLFFKCIRVYDVFSLSAVDFLKYKLIDLENEMLPYYLKLINMTIIHDPFHIIVILQEIQSLLMTSPIADTFFPMVDHEIESLTNNCNKILKDAHIHSRKLNQNIQRSLTERKYYTLIQTIEEFMTKYPISMAAQKALTMLMKMTPYYSGEPLDFIKVRCAWLQLKEPNHHLITTMILPHVKYYAISSHWVRMSLEAGSPDVEITYGYFRYGHNNSVEDSIMTSYRNKKQQVEHTTMHKD